MFGGKNGNYTMSFIMDVSYEYLGFEGLSLDVYSIFVSLLCFFESKCRLDVIFY